MPACKYKSIDISLFLCQKLEPEKEMQFREHLRSCKHCRQKMKRIEHIARNLKHRETTRMHGLKNSFKLVAVFVLVFGTGVICYLSRQESAIQKDIPDSYFYRDTLSRYCDTINRIYAEDSLSSSIRSHE